MIFIERFILFAGEGRGSHCQGIAERGLRLETREAARSGGNLGHSSDFSLRPSSPFGSPSGFHLHCHWWHWQRYGKRDERLARFSEEKARHVMYVGLLHFFLFISIVCAVNVGKLHLQPATTFIPAFFYSSILWPVILAQREVKQKRQQNVLRQSPSRSSFGAVLKVMLGFSKECQNVPYFCRLVTWRLRQCLDILFKGVSTVSEAPSFDTTCYTAWNIQLTRGAGLGLASEHLDLLLSEDVKIGRDRKLSETDRVCEYDDMIYIYIYT